MASISGKVSFQCDGCGSPEFSLPDDATGRTPIICDGCGQSVGTVADVNAQIIQAGKSIVRDIADHLRQQVKGLW